jgi:hypothetical protein
MKIEIIDTGEVPPRPAFLNKPNSIGSADAVALHLFRTGAITVIGGVAVDNDGGVLPVVSILLFHMHRLCGWTLSGDELIFVDTDKAPITVLPVPNLLTYFVATTDDVSLVTEAASKDQLKSMVEFVYVFISDEGPPAGVDW